MFARRDFLQMSAQALCVWVGVCRIIGGYLAMAGIGDIQHPLPRFGGPASLAAASPLPRAYGGLGFSDSISFLTSDRKGAKAHLNLDRPTFARMARSHLYSFDPYLHSIFWPIKAPVILPAARAALAFGFCRGGKLAMELGLGPDVAEFELERRSVIDGKANFKMRVRCL